VCNKAFEKSEEIPIIHRQAVVDSPETFELVRIKSLNYQSKDELVTILKGVQLQRQVQS
jgi:hypothetical protein